MAKKCTFRIPRRVNWYLAQMLLIIVSVLLAFFLNELRNQSLKDKRLETSLHFIQSEILTNQQILQEAMIVHKEVVRKIDSLLQRNDLEGLYDETDGFSYQRIYAKSYFDELLSSDAWQIAYQNQVFNEMEMQDVVVLSRAYEQQELVMSHVWQISEYLQSARIFSKKRTEENCKLLRKRFQVLVGLELRLESNYNTAIQLLENRMK